MKKCLYIALAILAYSCQNPGEVQDETSSAKEKTDQPIAELLWTSGGNLWGVESVLWDPEQQLFFASCVHGQDTKKDTLGYIVTIDAAGELLDDKWLKGDFHAPKGLALHGDTLFVTDIDRVLGFHRKTKEKLYEEVVDSARYLNDLVVHQGRLYATDMQRFQLLRFGRAGHRVVQEDLRFANGLASFRNRLYVNTDNGVYSPALGQIHEERWMSRLVNGGDGLAVLDSNTLLISRWEGQLWYLKNDQVYLLIDTKTEEIQATDFYFRSSDSTLYLPTYHKGEVRAYKLRNL